MKSRKIHLSEAATLLLLLVAATMQLCIITVTSSAILSNEQGNKQAPPAPPSGVNQENQNLVDSMVAKTRPQQQQQSATKQTNNQQETSQQQTKQRSNNAADDDLIPLATINNHSRNNQNLLRPPQYVDVSALVSNGRNMTFATNGANTNGANTNGAVPPPPPMSASNSISPNSVLSPKSRSGLPECATQQVCNAIFVRMNHTQRLCECSSNYNWKCSNNLDPQDGHTIELTRKFDKRIYTQIKTCEPLREVRACKSPTDWTLLALQSERSGKAHYVVVCKCPTWAQLEGPYTHNHPPYANIPGIRVYGMLCAHQTARSSTAQSYSSYNPSLGIYPEFPWSEALNVLNTTNLANTLDNGSH